MTRTEGNSEFCFPSPSLFPEGNIEVKGMWVLYHPTEA